MFHQLLQNTTSKMISFPRAVEGETKFLKAYDSNGKAYLMDAEVEPDVPIIVIGNNERMDMIEGSKKGSKDTNAKTSGRMQSINYLKCPDLKKISRYA